MMLAAETPAEQALAADLAALLEERDPLRAPEAPADIGSRLHAIRHGDPDADRGALAPHPPHRAPIPAAGCVCPTISQADGDPGRAARRRVPRPHRPAPRRAGVIPSSPVEAAGGCRVTDPLAKASLLVAAALDVESRRPASGSPLALDPDDLPPALAARVTEQVEAGFDPVSGSVLARRRRRLGA